jgi:hypothetical protein
MQLNLLFTMRVAVFRESQELGCNIRGATLSMYMYAPKIPHGSGFNGVSRFFSIKPKIASICQDLNVSLVKEREQVQRNSRISKLFHADADIVGLVKPPSFGLNPTDNAFSSRASRDGASQNWFIDLRGRFGEKSAYKILPAFPRVRLGLRNATNV